MKLGENHSADIWVADQLPSNAYKFWMSIIAEVRMIPDFDGVYEFTWPDMMSKYNLTYDAIVRSILELRVLRLAKNIETRSQHARTQTPRTTIITFHPLVKRSKAK